MNNCINCKHLKCIAYSNDVFADCYCGIRFRIDPASGFKRYENCVDVRKRVGPECPEFKPDLYTRIKNAIMSLFKS